MEEVKIKSFLKFGSEENILDLLDNGTMYCNSIEHFRKTEDEYLRGDSYEGTFKITNFSSGSKLELTFQNEKKMQFNAGAIHFREFYSEIKGNIYCLTAVTEQEVIQAGSLKLDTRLTRFGTHFLLIADTQKFYDLLISNLEKSYLKIKIGFVTYYSKNTINAELDFFHKPNDFEYQKEFRILIENEEVKPIIIQLGSLRDVAQMFEIKDLESMEYFTKHST